MKTYGNDKPDIRFEMKFGELNAVSQHKDFPVFNVAELVVGIAAPGCANYTRKEIDALIDWVKRPQVGASGMVYVKCEEDGSFKSSVDKFYDQDDLKNLARTMNTHLRSLSGKNYADVVKKNLSDKNRNIGNIITLMFVPSEHAIEKIIEADSNFMEKAWKANIFPVGPAGLMNMLSFAKFQISEQMMMHSHHLIIEEVKKLMSSVGNLAEHSVRLGSSLSSTVNHYDKFAASFNRNFLSKVRNISKMGIDGGLKKTQETLQRFHLVTSQSEPIEIENDQHDQIEEKTEET
jgi:DNA anti-recombination protein RmuC